MRKEQQTYITSGALTVNGGVTISGNTATHGDGGGIFIEDETGTLIVQSSATESVTISGNTAGNEQLGQRYTEDQNDNNRDLPGGNGGGIYAGKGSKVRITGNADNPVVISGNRAVGGSTGFASSGHGGGAILLYDNKDPDGGVVHLDYVNVLDNTSEVDSGDGGGVYCYNTSVSLTYCKIERNLANSYTSGGTANGKGGGLQVYQDTEGHTVSIDNCYFKGNECSSWGGGAHFVNALDIDITNSTFDGNKANQGGGIHTYNSKSMGVIDLNNVYIGNNKIRKDAGGGIYLCGYTATLKDTYIGWIKQNASDANETAVAAGNTTQYAGAGIYVYYTAKLQLDSNVNISNNVASESGGGVYFDAYWGSNDNIPVFSGVTLNNNEATTGNGGAIYVARCVNEKNTTLYPERAYEDEAGKRIELRDCTLIGNKAKRGGGLYASNIVVFINNKGNGTLFEGNEAARGGAIYIQDGGYKNLTLDAFKISGTTKFISNEANGFVDAENSENNLSGDGGAIYVNGGRGFIVNSVFEKNTAEDNGGAVYINGNDTYGHYGISTVAFGNSDSTLSSTSYNSATNGNGGAVCVVGGHHFVVVRGGFYANQAPNGEGGGVYVEGVENTVITRDATVFNGCHSAGISNDIENFENLEVIFSGNQAGNGGAVAVKSDATLDYTRILYNTAYQNGGGIYAADGAVVTANRLVVFYNDALNNGGGLCAVGGAQITCNTELGAAIYENDAQNNGGGVYVEGTGSKVTLGKGYIYKNWAGYQTSNKSVIVATMPDGSTTMDSAANVHGVGGGVAVFDGGAFEMKDTGAIYDNRAAIGARDVFANGSDTKLTILAANAIDKDGERIFDRPAHAFVREDNNTNGMWWEDYKNDDAQYKAGLYGDPTGVAQRYDDSAVSIRAFVDANEDVGSEQYKQRYVNMDDQFVSIVFEVQKYNVGTITIIAPEGEGVENQRFVFEVKGDPVKGDDFTLSISLLGGESVTITDLVPGTYTITQKTDWSWRFDYEGVVITAVNGDQGTDKTGGVVEITIKGTTRDEAHTVVYDNEKVENKWLSHNSEGVENVAKTIANVSFDMAEAKKGYVI